MIFPWMTKLFGLKRTNIWNTIRTIHRRSPMNSTIRIHGNCFYQFFTWLFVSRNYIQFLVITSSKVTGNTTGQPLCNCLFSVWHSIAFSFFYSLFFCIFGNKSLEMPSCLGWTRGIQLKNIFAKNCAHHKIGIPTFVNVRLLHLRILKHRTFRRGSQSLVNDRNTLAMTFFWKRLHT